MSTTTTTSRPYVNVPEGPDGANVYRQMNDAEYAQWQTDQANQPPPPGPDAQQIASALVDAVQGASDFASAQSALAAKLGALGLG